MTMAKYKIRWLAHNFLIKRATRNLIMVTLINDRYK